MKYSVEKQIEYKSLLMRTRVPHTAYAVARKEIARSYHALGTTSFPQCQQLLGVSRSGKSMLAMDFLDGYPSRRTEAGNIHEIVYACIPPKGTTKGLLENLLRALGDPHWDRGAESRKLASLINLLEGCKCRAIILDEFQHLADKGQKNQNLQFTINFIKSLVEPNKWLLIASGLPSANRVIEQDAQLRNRFPNALTLPRFDWFDHELRGEFMGVLGCFQKALKVFDLPQLDSEEMTMRFYLATGGLIGLLTRILQRAVEDAVDENRRAISMKHFSEAFEREVRFAHHYGANGPFKMKVAEAPMGQCLKEVAHLIESEGVELPDAQTEVIIKTSNKTVTKRQHTTELGLAFGAS